jgi:hypothetical protein
MGMLGVETASTGIHGIIVRRIMTPYYVWSTLVHPSFLSPPLILLPSARLTFPIPNNQAAALIRLFNSSIANPVFAAVPSAQHDGTTSLHQWSVTARIAHFVRPHAQSHEPYLLTLAGIT